MTENFHVVNQLPQDIMHVLLEGVIPYELTLMLTFFIVNKCFTCAQLNDRIQSYEYSSSEANDKPSLIHTLLQQKDQLFLNHVSLCNV